MARNPEVLTANISEYGGGKGYNGDEDNGRIGSQVRTPSSYTLQNCFRCAFIDKSAVNGMSVVPILEFMDLTVGSIINSIMMGKRFDEDTKAEFFHIKKLVDESMKLVTPLDLVLPIWMLRAFSEKRFALMMDAQTETMDYLAKDAVKRYEDVVAGKLTIDPENPKDYVDSFILKMMQEGRDKNAFRLCSIGSFEQTEHVSVFRL